MNAAAGLDLQSIPDRIQAEVQRAIQRSIKGVEYFSTSGPTLGSTPKDILAVRGTMNLYPYRPMSDEIYRVPILIVMATTNRGYILDLVPGQSFIEFLLKRGYDVYMLDWSAPRPEEKKLRMEDYVLDFIPDCVRRVQQDSGEADVSVIGYCFGGTTSLELGRAGCDLKAIVGFHSGLATARPQDAANIRGKVLVCIGADDPIIPPEQRADFEKEMKAAGVDWRLQLYGGAGHSFTNPAADSRGMEGFFYHEATDRRRRCRPAPWP